MWERHLSSLAQEKRCFPRTHHFRRPVFNVSAFKKVTAQWVTETLRISEGTSIVRDLCQVWVGNRSLCESTVRCYMDAEAKSTGQSWVRFACAKRNRERWSIILFQGQGTANLCFGDLGASMPSLGQSSGALWRQGLHGSASSTSG